MGLRLEKPQQVAGTWEKALRADRPVVTDAVTDPEIVVFTPEIAAKFADELSQAL